MIDKDSYSIINIYKDYFETYEKKEKLLKELKLEYKYEIYENDWEFDTLTLKSQVYFKNKNIYYKLLKWGTQGEYLFMATSKSGGIIEQGNKSLTTYNFLKEEKSGKIINTSKKI